MLAVYARYRGREVHRESLVRRSAEALSTMHGVGTFQVLGEEDICATVDSPEAICDTVMALLSDGSWAAGIGILPGSVRTEAEAEAVRRVAATSLARRARSGSVGVRVASPGAGSAAGDISATFALIGYALSKRTVEGREATSLMRAGMNQNEAAEELGISKQAMSQRLQAAGWQAETAGWQLAVNLIRRAEKEA